jgi:acylphosphatase
MGAPSAIRLEFAAMTDDAAVARHVIVEGLVQGVGYRDFARRAALRLGVSGWVRNRSDGTVEALIAGAPAPVEAMLAELRRGPRGAEVTSLQILDPGEADDAKTGTFIIRFTM